MTQPKRRYKDLNMSMLTNPSTGDLLFIRDDEAIKRSVRNIILSNIYERHFDTSFGCQVTDLLFENISYFTVASLQTTIESAIAAYEPRVQLTELIIDLDEENNGYSASITFNVIGESKPITIDLFLEKIR